MLASTLILVAALNRQPAVLLSNPPDSAVVDVENDSAAIALGQGVATGEPRLDQEDQLVEEIFPVAPGEFSGELSGGAGTAGGSDKSR